MKYKVILKDEEINKLLNINYENIGQAIDILEKTIPNFDLKDNKYQFMFEIATTVSGKIENNDEDLFCPNCNGKYVVRTYAGDLYYRLIMGTEAQKEVERQKFARMGLYSNPWACAEEFSRDYWCLNCGIRWNGKDKDILADERFL